MYIFIMLKKYNLKILFIKKNFILNSEKFYI